MQIRSVSGDLQPPTVMSIVVVVALALSSSSWSDRWRAAYDYLIYNRAGRGDPQPMPDRAEKSPERLARINRECPRCYCSPIRVNTGAPGRIRTPQPSDFEGFDRACEGVQHRPASGERAHESVRGRSAAFARERIVWLPRWLPPGTRALCLQRGSASAITVDSRVGRTSAHDRERIARRDRCCASLLYSDLLLRSRDQAGECVQGLGDEAEVRPLAALLQARMPASTRIVRWWETVGRLSATGSVRSHTHASPSSCAATREISRRRTGSAIAFSDTASVSASVASSLGKWDDCWTPERRPATRRGPRPLRRLCNQRARHRGGCLLRRQLLRHRRDRLVLQPGRSGGRRELWGRPLHRG